MPLFLVTEADRVVLSPSRAALARSIDAASGRGSLLSDPLFAREVQAIDGTDTMLLLAAPGRLAEMALPFVPRHDRRQLEPVGELLSHSVLSARLVHDDTRLGIHFRLGNLPDVSELVARALRGEDPLGRSGSQKSNRTASAGQSIPAPSFRDLLHSGSR